jgi:integrase
LAVDAGKLLARPKVRLLSEDNARQGFFEREQFVSVLGHLSGPLQAVALFTYFTGWRKSEILALEWRRVDRKAGIVRLDVGTTKNGDGREFAYGALPDVKAMIDRQWAAHEAMAKAGPLRTRFTGSNAEPVSGGSRTDPPEQRPTLCPFVFQRNGKRIPSFRKAWIAACKLAGCPGRIPHDFRRTAVRNLERAGVSRSVAMKLTGHKTENVYRRYAIVSSGDLADASRKLHALTGTISGTNSQSDESAPAEKASA